MAEIMSFYPTVGMPADQRNEAGYYAVIKAWVQEHIDIFEKRFTVAYDDTEHEITFTPIAENISNRPLIFEISSDNLYLRFPYASSSSSTAYTVADLVNDPPIHIYDDNDFFIGAGGLKLFYGLFWGKKFDDNTDVVVLLGLYGSGNYIYIYYKTGTSADWEIGTTHRREAALTDTYIVQRLIIKNASIIMNNVFYLDSGMSLPPANDFKIGDTKYNKISYNIVTKL